ncbi:hypothetical protein H257_18225 [Aphanomyces astaci]|uniref:Uncharacterized protein n=1 Tax=Aphanomyces astaci TaxID=112090 RepID=W4FBW8_APHAT|nr:hypothetical protein H257_18225 [Aphanomyces astaci]ETV64970.1 hypothetical protein H257_18225 [Aphanomyces astaci]|eukprot:XP_009845546.1 hypothetical protein H257_18225 [Aphanomyces astaci]
MTPASTKDACRRELPSGNDGMAADVAGASRTFRLGTLATKRTSSNEQSPGASRGFTTTSAWTPVFV